ncbi:MAG: 3-deoxy-manno-octulosonate cytidylyltransferase [Acidobacteriota bacterium]
MKKALGIIPARYASSRFMGKPLAMIKDKPMIIWVYERAKKAKLLRDVIVATDSYEVQRKVEKYGGNALITFSSHSTGTERIAEVSEKYDDELIVNIQGDEPLISPLIIDKMVEELQDITIDIVTVKEKILDDSYLSPNMVKVITDLKGFAIYFSRSPIPYCRQDNRIYFKHIGVYGFKKQILLNLVKLSPSPLERIENLEQLRAIEYGYKIKVIESPYHTIGVDTPEDIEKIEMELKNAI